MTEPKYIIVSNADGLSTRDMFERRWLPITIDIPFHIDVTDEHYRCHSTLEEIMADIKAVMWEGMRRTPADQSILVSRIQDMILTRTDLRFTVTLPRKSGHKRYPVSRHLMLRPHIPLSLMSPHQRKRWLKRRARRITRVHRK